MLLWTNTVAIANCAFTALILKSCSEVHFNFDSQLFVDLEKIETTEQFSNNNSAIVKAVEINNTQMMMKQQ